MSTAVFPVFAAVVFAAAAAAFTVATLAMTEPALTQLHIYIGWLSLLNSLSLLYSLCLDFTSRCLSSLSRQPLKK